MKPIWKLAAATAGGAAAAALSALPASAATVHATPAPAHPVFVQTDNTAGMTGQAPALPGRRSARQQELSAGPDVRTPGQRCAKHTMPATTAH